MPDKANEAKSGTSCVRVKTPTRTVSTTSWMDVHPPVPMQTSEFHSTRSSRAECGGMLPGDDQLTVPAELPKSAHLPLPTATWMGCQVNGDQRGPTPRTV